jgi:hypothetical protein
MVAVSSFASAEDRFALAVGPKDSLFIYGPKGDQVAEVKVPSIALTATTAGATFQISYGRDASGHLTAIIAPVISGGPALHFNVLKKAIDADQAIVTLTFSNDLQSVSVDPGYSGSVEVNSHHLRQHLLSDDAPIPMLNVPGQFPPSPVVAVITPAQPQPSTAATPSPAVPSPTTSTAAPAPLTKADLFATTAPVPMASQMSPSVLDNSATDTQQVAANSAAQPASATAANASNALASDDSTTTKTVKLYWSEPVTPFDGSAPPPCGLDEIRLVEVYGTVTITLPTGQTETGANGMIIPSGSSVYTAENSSTALFLGGVSSARLLPRCDLTVTQTFDGTNRKDTLDLRKGAVFARIGQREGEVQDYTIHTPEGTSSPNYPNMLAFRGSPDDVPGVRAALNSGRLIDPHRLLAWNPISFGPNLVSDVVNPIMAAGASGTNTSSMFFYTPSQSLSVGQVQSEVIATNKTSGEATNADNPNTILQNILTAVAPYNQKLTKLLYLVDSGTATKGELAFYHNLLSVYFTDQVPSIANNTKGQTSTGITESRLALLRDLIPFKLPEATSF